LYNFLNNLSLSSVLSQILFADRASPMATRLPLTEVHSLCVRALTRSGVFSESSTAIANIIRDAERDGCKSHGLFRLPGYCEAVRMGKVDPLAEPVVTGGDGSSSIVHVDAARGFAPLAFQRGLPSLVDATRRSGVGLMVLSNQFHFSALWHEVEALADEGLAGLSFLNTKAFVAHHGGSQRIYGTNPMAFGFPRPAECGPPLLWDQAAATMARGEISLVQQAGERLPPGVGIDANGAPTDDPQAALDGAQLTFAGAKVCSSPAARPLTRLHFCGHRLRPTLSCTPLNHLRLPSNPLAGSALSRAGHLHCDDGGAPVRGHDREQLLV